MYETLLFVSFIGVVVSAVLTLLTLTYLFTWIASTSGQAGLPPGFFSLIGIFMAAGFFSGAILLTTYTAQNLSKD